MSYHREPVQLRVDGDYFTDIAAAVEATVRLSRKLPVRRSRSARLARIIGRKGRA